MKAISVAYENSSLCDDFNINPLHKDIWAERFCDNVTACGLYIVNQCPTRFAPHCKHALIFSNKSFSIHLDQLTLAGISDHDLLFYVYLNSESNHCFCYYDDWRCGVRGRALASQSILTLFLLTVWNCFWYFVNNKLELFTQVLQIFLMHTFRLREK